MAHGAGIQDGAGGVPHRRRRGGGHCVFPRWILPALPRSGTNIYTFQSNILSTVVGFVLAYFFYITVRQKIKRWNRKKNFFFRIMRYLRFYEPKNT